MQNRVSEHFLEQCALSAQYTDCQKAGGLYFEAGSDAAIEYLATRESWGISPFPTTEIKAVGAATEGMLRASNRYDHCYALAYIGHAFAEELGINARLN